MRECQIAQVIDGPLAAFRGEVKKVYEQTAKVAVQVKRTSISQNWLTEAIVRSLAQI